MPAGWSGLLGLGLQSPAPISWPGFCQLVDPVFVLLPIAGGTSGFASLPLPVPIAPSPPYGIASQWVFYDPMLSQFVASSALVL